MKVPPIMRCVVRAIVLAAVVAGAPIGAQAAVASCTAFQSAFTKNLSGFRVDFSRSLVVSRGGGGLDIFDLVTDVDVDGSLQCRGEKLVRFEAKIAVPANARVADRFEKVKQAALLSALQWRPARIQTVLKDMDADVVDYLQASQQRGDVFVAGKTESHEGGSDLGLIWTLTDRTFIIVGEES